MTGKMFVSVIIPMRNEQAYVAACLDSVLAQIEGVEQIEIICADGASTDGTRDIVLEYAEKDGRVILLDNPARIVPTGMNKAIAAARGEVIIRLDCHARYAPDYIQSCLEVLQRTGADNVGGYMKTESARDTAVGRAIAAATSSRFGVGGSTFRIGGDEQEVDTVPFGCFRRDVFDRFGMYDERLVRNQDIELNTRIRKMGGRIVISPKIQLTYYNRGTFAGLRQQAFNNGLWNPYTLYLVGGGLRPRHLIPLAFVGSVVLLAVVGIFFWPAWIALAAELLLYFTGGTIMARRAAEKERRLWPLIVLAFVQLHIAYGIGSLWGIITAPVKFRGKRRKTPGESLSDRRD